MYRYSALLISSTVQYPSCWKIVRVAKLQVHLKEKEICKHPHARRSPGVDVGPHSCNKKPLRRVCWNDHTSWRLQYDLALKPRLTAK